MYCANVTLSDPAVAKVFSETLNATVQTTEHIRAAAATPNVQGKDETPRCTEKARACWRLSERMSERMRKRGGKGGGGVIERGEGGGVQHVKCIHRY
jgi:hypothetical protein